MTDKRKDDIFYVCTIIEFIARKTQNHRKDIIAHFDRDDLSRQSLMYFHLLSVMRYQILIRMSITAIRIICVVPIWRECYWNDSQDDKLVILPLTKRNSRIG